MDLVKYYTEHSPHSLISQEFADTFAGTPNEIFARVRKKMIHPCENPSNFDRTNWPKIKVAAEIERDFTTHEICFGTCRKYALASVAVLRSKGFAARCRCGFATYFDAGWYEDHWVVEYMDKGKWHLADAQTMRVDLMRGQFIDGATAWKLVRERGFDANAFGFSGQAFFEHGMNYVVGQLIRDASGMLKRELNYEQIVRFVKSAANLSPTEIERYDHIADLILAEDIENLEREYDKIIGYMTNV